MSINQAKVVFIKAAIKAQKTEIRMWFRHLKYIKTSKAKYQSGS